MNKKIKIICKSISCINQNKYCISIYDKNNNFLCKGYTNNEGIFTFNAKLNKFYKITISHNYDIYPKTLSSAFVIYENSNTTFKFIFGKNICTQQVNRPITFTLTDEEYTGLPIERGVINLWPIQRL